MADEELGERCEELAHEVLRPLVLGGPVCPVRPFGAHLGLRLGIERDLADVGLRTELDVARVRRARLLAPVDTLPPLDEGDWAVLAAYNDLLQLTNQHLAGPFTRGRYTRLMQNLRWLCDRIPAPGTVEAALARHATFARALEVVRTDSTVSWWTGSARFRGEIPPKRLLAWKELRRVQVDARRVAICDMTLGITGVSADEFNEVLSLWLTRSPLTDIAEATRRAPAFAWSASTLSLIATAPGRALGFRSLARKQAEPVKAALARAAQLVPAKYEEARQLAEAFAKEVSEGFAKRAEDESEPGEPSRRAARAAARAER